MNAEQTKKAGFNEIEVLRFENGLLRQEAEYAQSRFLSALDEIDTLKAELLARENVPWRSLKDDPPTEEGDYFFWDTNWKMAEPGSFTFEYGESIDHVSHWQPIPAHLKQGPVT